MLRDLQACLGLKGHLDLREPVGTLDQRVTMDLLVLPDNLDLPKATQLPLFQVQSFDLTLRTHIEEINCENGEC